MQQSARRCDGGEQRDDGADQEEEREALHRGDGDQEEDECGDRRDDVRVENRVEALAVAGGDRGAHGLPGAHFFLDAFEDDDVRVCGDADRQDQAREARQRQIDAREEQDRGVVEERVDAEADHGDEAEEAVEHEQEERDDDEADERRVPRLRERALAERRRDIGALDLLEAHRQRTGLEDQREVFRLLDRAAVPRSISAFGPAMPFGFCLKSMYGVDSSWPSRTIAKCWT